MNEEKYFKESDPVVIAQEAAMKKVVKAVCAGLPAYWDALCKEEPFFKKLKRLNQEAKPEARKPKKNKMKTYNGINRCPWCQEHVDKFKGVAATQDGMDVLFHHGCSNVVQMFNELKTQIEALRQVKPA